MAMDPNRNNNSSNQNNQNRQLTPGASSRAAHLLPPVAGGQSIFLLSRNLPMLHRRFEDMLRRCVREEFHKMSHYFNLPPRLLPDPNIQARYRLQFINKVKSPTFTTDLVRDDNGDPIKVEIYDTYTQSKVSPGSLLASAKVRITVLDAEFWKNKGVNWSRSEFIQSMLREREGRGTILTGPDLIIRLENGVGTFGNIVFNDNSKWTKSGFRLGVMFEGDGEEGYLNGERVRESVSESIRVKDRRGKVSQKPDRLELKQGVQCLEKVGKDRASLLQSNNIITVEDFLCWYYNNEPALREILRVKSESDKGWTSMVKHAMQCAIEFHAKYPSLNNSCQPPQVLVHPMERNMPLCINNGPRVVGSGSSEPNPFENGLIEEIIGDMPAFYEQLPDICDISSMNVLNEHISTASDEHTVETQHPLFHETNLANVDRGNILNGDSVQLTNGGGSPQLELSSDFNSIMEYLYADAESTADSFMHPLRNNDFDARVGVCFTGSMSNSVHVGPLIPRSKRKIKAFLWSVAFLEFLAIPRKRARIAPPANQTTLLAI